MWRPGFPFVAMAPGTVHGFHRAFCVYSHHYRGTAEHPGLVLGLDRGGSCHGMAFAVEREAWPETHAYLRERELVTQVYREALLTVRTGGRIVRALAYVVDRGHDQYAVALSLDEQARLIAQGCGVSGRCTDYALATLAHLREAGIHDRRLERLSRIMSPASGPVARRPIRRSRR
jgi:glutathione-specific gamma-glutamylcyclotransferase